jgi:4-diphosphocytidyl-2-C-methyl-D-erythritol kinase
MISFPGCKINLGLHILDRRPDGYHNIHTCFHPVPWSDVLEFLPAEQQSFEISGLDIPGALQDNLCLKAYQLLRDDYQLAPVQGHLHKNVPPGAGLGGGSADAAQTLRTLNKLFDLKLNDERLADYAARLGSDCPYFLIGSPALGSGRGDRLEPCESRLSGCFLVIVVPPIHVSTAEAYRAVTPRTPFEDLRTSLARPLSEWKEYLVNDFEAPVFALHPELSDVKRQLYSMGAIFAGLTGSGAALFGLFDREVSREFFQGLGWSGWI